MRIKLALLIAAVFVLSASPALAHVTIQPKEAVAGSFARFVVRVPNERDKAATTKVEVQLPESLVAVSFQPKAGWKRTTETKGRRRVVEVFGEEVTDYTATVTWEGGKIAPGEFEEFGFSARLPDDPATLEVPALQTYDSGEVVRWIGPADADEPAARVTTYSLGEGEEQPGELATLAALADDDDDNSNTGIVLGSIGMGIGALALVVALLRRQSA